MTTLTTRRIAVASAFVSLSLVAALPARAQMAPTNAMSFLTLANGSNTFEIQSSQLAEQKTRSPSILRFARDMIRDHSMAARNMAAAEQSAGMPPMPPALDPPHAALLAQLQGAGPGPQFDRLYVQMQLQGHQQAVGLFKTYGRGGDNPVIVAFARQSLRVLEHHLRRIEEIANRGAPGPIAGRPLRSRRYEATQP